MASKKKVDEKPSQVVLIIECVVTKEVVCEGCTVEQARESPWDYAVDEHEVEQIDWEVKRVKGVEQ